MHHGLDPQSDQTRGEQHKKDSFQFQIPPLALQLPLLAYFLLSQVDFCASSG
jgi:hypothetical protein